MRVEAGSGGRVRVSPAPDSFVFVALTRTGARAVDVSTPYGKVSVLLRRDEGGWQTEVRVRATGDVRLVRDVGPPDLEVLHLRSPADPAINPVMPEPAARRG